MPNGVRLLRGSVEDVKFFGQLLVYSLRARVYKDDCSEEQAFRTIAYAIPIMGNPSNPKEVILWLRLDKRSEDGSEIRIEHGAEYIDWEVLTGSLCNCCHYNRGHGKKGAGQYVCLEWLGPSDSKKSCTSYKFSETKLKEYFSKTKVTL